MDYFDNLEDETQRLYKIAQEARSKGYDIETEPEIPLAKDLAERVEGLVGPEGVAKRIKEFEETLSREEVAFEVAREIVSPANKNQKEPIEVQEQKADQALRTGLAIITEGVVAAPLEGIAKIKIKRNFDQSWYLGIYFAGPIRSAGGTASALAVLIADYIRISLGLDVYQPTEREIERYVEEVELYESEVTNLQYSSSPEEVRLAVSKIPVEVTGEPTDKVEVSHRDLERVETNNIRGGALLALVEGVIQKAPKVLKYANKLHIEGWGWLEEFSKPKDKETEAEDSSKVEDKYMQDIIGGRPVLAYPHAQGGFRLRYGRSRNTGLAAMGVHPATMEILEFLAVGTQMKIERPGKGNCVVPCDTIEASVVKLKNGSVVRVTSVSEAKELKNQVAEILFLGDMLVAFGEFLRNNHELLPSAWCEEWWVEELKKSQTFFGDVEERLIKNLSAEEAFKLSEEHDIPLHPLYTYFYHDITREEFNLLRNWITSAAMNEDDGDLVLDLSPEKRLLEVLCVPHILNDRKIIISHDHAFTLKETMKNPLNTEDDLDTIQAMNQSSKIKIMAKAPTYLGGRVGRPEKTKERLMKPAPHALFPIGTSGGNRRNIVDAAKRGTILVEIARCKCTQCDVGSMQASCPVCGAPTIPTSSGKKRINLSQLLKKAYQNVGVRKLDELKGVQGMISREKFPEPLEKGILRSKNGVFTFKDATIRHDSTNLPITHFTPNEIGVTYHKLIELGYTQDIHGLELKNNDQIIEIKIQDLIVSESCGEYLLKVANFIDDLLERFYKMEPFYQVKTKEDLVGHLAVGLAPHTSAGVLGRIVGFTKAAACYAHPYFHSAKRRNCDSDEDSVMLLLDALLNFSKVYLPSTRGGRMDAPLVLSSRIDPEEIDDESHNLDTMEFLPLEFFEKSLEQVRPSDVLDLVDNVKKRLGTEDQYNGLIYSHETSSIHQGPKICLYKLLPTMKEKVGGQIGLAERIRAVDQKGVVEGVLNSHFLPDMAGNSRAFSRQRVRCTKCNKKYRRIPLSGECTCGGNLVLSISKGSVIKYLEISKELSKKYPINPYLVQRIHLLESSINSLFESDRSKQSSLDVFFG
jgi:DNA polymerase II large subunit